MMPNQRGLTIPIEGDNSNGWDAPKRLLKPNFWTFQFGKGTELLWQTTLWWFGFDKVLTMLFAAHCPHVSRGSVPELLRWGSRKNNKLLTRKNNKLLTSRANSAAEKQR
eukprot:5034599-Amphidinium_carterae.2